MTLQIAPRSLSDYVNALDARRPFALSRWGDGEWGAVLGDAGPNCDGHPYTDALRTCLQGILSDGLPYDHGFLTVARRVGMERIETYLKAHPSVASWVDGDALLVASCMGALLPLVEVLRGRRVIYVGPAYLRRLEEAGVFPFAAFVETPRINAFAVRRDVSLAIREAVRQTDADVIGFSCGFLAKALVHQLYGHFAGALTLIDFGSLWDVYVGEKTRTHNKKGPWDRLIPLNLGREL